MIKIRRGLAKQHIEESWPSEKLEEAHHWRLAQWVMDSVVSELWMENTCYTATAAWAKKSKELQGQPEVGGFYLGRYRVWKSAFHVYIQTFVPATEVAFQDKNSLFFGAGAMRELEQALSTYPTQQLVGWFHTHPGHSPYLSTTDLNRIHLPFFSRPYQVAIVIDPLTLENQTGIFTWKKNKEINNAGDWKNWISW